MTECEPDHAAGLGELLRSRRERLSPQEVGLPASARRCSLGLRAEEVALLANVSVSYYTVLEEGRAAPPSGEVLAVLADVLRLSPAERDQLYALARAEMMPTDEAEQLGAAVRALVDRLDPYPTYVTGRRWDVLAANGAARALFADWPAFPRQNLLRWMFTSAARDVYVDWQREAAAQLARFRSVAARHRDDPAFRELIEELHRDSTEVRDWWPRPGTAPPSGRVTRLRHPALGEFALQPVVLQVADDPEQTVVTFSDVDGGTRRLEMLRRTMSRGGAG